MEKAQFNPNIPTVAYELGNWGARSMATDLPISDYGEAFQHLYLEIDAARYEELGERLQKDETGFDLIRWNGRYFIIGERVLEEKGTAKPRLNQSRWQRDYIGVIMCSTMMRLYNGKIPTAVNMIVNYPPIDYQATTKLLKAVTGTWQFSTPREKDCRFTVEFAMPVDEIVGGIMNTELNPEGYPYEQSTKLIDRGPVLVLDFGGGTLDLCQIKRDGSINYRNLASERIGGHEGVQRFRALFARKYARYLEDCNGELSLELAYEALLSKDKTLYGMGETFLCEKIFAEAFQPILNQAKTVVQDFAKGFIGYNAVLITGGIGGLLYKEIGEQIVPQFWDRERVFHADDLDKMYLANCKGFRRMAYAMHLQHGQSASRRKVR